MDHTLVDENNLLHCTACDVWFTSAPTGPSAVCLGAPTYSWDRWPDGLFTAKQLKAKGLIPGPLRGLIPYSKSADGDGYLRVYRLEEAAPKPPKTPAQEAALAKMRAAQQAARTCGRCGVVQGSKRDLSYRKLCDHCEMQLAHEVARDEARTWAREVVAHPFVILDTETSGIGWGAEILSVAVVDHTGAVLLDTFVKPVNPILEEQFAPYDPYDWRHNAHGSPLTAYGVNGITNAMVEHAPDFPTVWAQLQPLLTDQRVIIYNASFERQILTTVCERHKLPLPDVSGFECLMIQFAGYFGEWSSSHGGWKWQSLDTAAAVMGVKNHQAHTAAADCLACLAVLQKLATDANSTDQD